MHNKTKIGLIMTLVLFLALGLFSTSNFRSAKSLTYKPFGMVLGEDDEKDDSEHQKEDEDKDKNKDDEKDDNNENDESEDQKNENKENSGKNEKKETRTSTVNKDGTRTVTKKKVEDNGKVEIETKTYDVSGRVVEELKSKAEDDKNEIEYEAKSFAGAGGKISEVKYKSKNGEEFKLMVKDADKKVTKVVYDEEHDYIKINGKGESEDKNLADDDSSEVFLKINPEGEYEVEHLGQKARVGIPITVDDADGSIHLLTDSGEKSLKHLPDAIYQKVKDSNASIEIMNAEIKEKDGKLVYELTAEKAEKIMGLFNTRINSLITYDAETGEEIQSSQSFWQNVVDVISF